MRDGIKLHTLLLRPKGDERPLPILLQRTPYGVPARAQQSLIRAPSSPWPTTATSSRSRTSAAASAPRGRSSSSGPARPCGPEGRRRDDRRVRHDRLAGQERGGEQRPRRDLGRLVPRMADGPGAAGPAPGAGPPRRRPSPGDQFLCDDEHHNGAFRLSPVFQYLAVMGRAKEFTPFDYGRRDTLRVVPRPRAAVERRRPPFPRQGVRRGTTWWSTPTTIVTGASGRCPRRLGRPRVPTLHVIGWWDQEDFSGPLRIYEAFEKHDRDGLNSLVAGPWNHGGWSRSDGDRLGPVTFGSPTARDFREQVHGPLVRPPPQGQGR